MIAVTFALPAESSEFLRQLHNKSHTHRAGLTLTRGTVHNRQIEILHTGVGEKVCRERLGKFLQDQQFEILISSGFAGALDDQLEPGDLLLAENFSTLEPGKGQSSCSELRIRTGNLLTALMLIDSSEERRKIARTSGAAAVDMETEFIARACAAHGVPVLSLRVITDTPLKPFPAPTDVLFDIANQRTDLAKFAKFFVTHPKRVSRLLQFAKGIAHARKRLAEALVQILRDL